MDTGGGGVTAIQTAVWAAASRTLTTAGGAIVGGTLQPLSVTSNIPETAVANTTCLNFSGVGVLAAIGFVTTAAFSAGTGTTNVVITVDGVAFTLNLRSGAMNWVNASKAIANQTSGNGANVSDFLNLSVPIQFNTSLNISYQVTATTLTAGATTVTIMWSHQ